MHGLFCVLECAHIFNFTTFKSFTLWNMALMSNIIVLTVDPSAFRVADCYVILYGLLFIWQNFEAIFDLDAEEKVASRLIQWFILLFVALIVHRLICAYLFLCTTNPQNQMNLWYTRTIELEKVLFVWVILIIIYIFFCSKIYCFCFTIHTLINGRWKREQWAHHLHKTPVITIISTQIIAKGWIILHKTQPRFDFICFLHRN